LKRNKFLKHLRNNNIEFHRHGKKHDVYKNSNNGKKSTIPRHPDIDEVLCDLICKQFGIDKP